MLENSRPRSHVFHSHSHLPVALFATHHHCLQVLVKDPWPLLYHGEPIYRNGKVCGTIRSSSYGHTLGGSVGLAMIDATEGGAKVRARVQIFDHSNS